jgi:DNA-binding CsgD family transcriptional regulator
MPSDKPEAKVRDSHFERALDPDDWTQFRRLGHKLLDDICDHLSTIRDRPTWRPMPDDVKRDLIQPVPLDGKRPESAYQDFLENVLPFPNGNIHPRFSGWGQGTVTPLTMLAEMLASAINPRMVGFNQAPVPVEKQVIAWIADLFAEAIRVAARGESFLQPSAAAKVVAEFPRPTMETVSPAQLIEPLSAREYEILRVIATGASNREIANTLYIAEGTVKNHITNILGKLGVRDRAHAVLKARDTGLI